MALVRQGVVTIGDLLAAQMRIFARQSGDSLCPSAVVSSVEGRPAHPTDETAPQSARYRPAPNRVDPEPPPPGDVIGSQFLITLADMSHLAGQVSVIGACEDLTIVTRIARRVSQGESARLREAVVR
jgi:hypothetical protein